MVSIRPFQPGDRPHIRELWALCGLTRPWNDPDLDIDRKVAVGDGLFLVAEADGELLGAAMFGYDGHRGWVNYLGVDPGARNRGIGRLLMAAGDTLLRSRGCPKLNLQIRADNEGAVAFYDRLGYRVDEVASMGKRLFEDAPVSPS
jgi:ribosomal protein S18 acetylase RimI-like enzyme